MKTTGTHYKTKTATENEIFAHLTACSDTFIPPLAHRVNINEYARKIFVKSVTFEAWAAGHSDLVGCVATYFNDPTNSIAFITSVSVLDKFVGRGIASHLLKMCIEYARKNHFREIKLEVDDQNSGAIGLYKKLGFTVYDTKGNLLLMRRQT